MGRTLWKDEMILDAYCLAVSGLKNTEIAKGLGISKETFKKWGKTKPIFRKAVTRGRKVYKGSRDEAASFRNYVYHQLPPKLKKLWEEINECDDSKISGIKRIEALLKKQGKRARQHIFIYAWIENNFHISNALKKANISRTCFNNWMENEPEFAKLVDEIHWHKKNFYEAGLTSLVAAGNAPCTIFANKTINADRGYAEKLKIDMNAQVTQEMQAYIPISELDLTVKIKKIVLKAIRKYKKEHQQDD